MNDDKAVKEVAEKTAYSLETVAGWNAANGRTMLSTFVRLCVSQTRELQAIREAAESLADSVTAHIDSDSCDFCRVKAEKVLSLLQRAALEGK